MRAASTWMTSIRWLKITPRILCTWEAAADPDTRWNEARPVGIDDRSRRHFRGLARDRSPARHRDSLKDALKASRSTRTKSIIWTGDEIKSMAGLIEFVAREGNFDKQETQPSSK